jgi:pimeloyl-ACP methyl ester carboxylesterase
VTATSPVEYVASPNKVVSAIDAPVFVASGDNDPMILAHYSYLLAGLIPHAMVKIYPGSAHGFLFQHHAEFAGDVEAFLTAPLSSLRKAA